MVKDVSAYSTFTGTPSRRAAVMPGGSLAVVGRGAAVMRA
jgi:hypothetical protein